ncbi:MAG: hypothetical protein R3248_06120 [Candidatus Promineifilaceae bacterium]|nr:hypothetical protein [Candidatus Promineifilaceae bacterium]
MENEKKFKGENGELLSWLLASKTPSLRSLTLLYPCRRPPGDAEVVAARRAGRLSFAQEVREA